MKPTIAKTVLLLLIALSAGCRNNEASVDQDASGISTQIWRSENFDVSAELQQGWRTSHINSPGDTFDRPEGVVAAFLNSSGPYSYIIRVEKDPTSEQISNSDYLNAVRKQYESHPAYTLVDADDVDFHDRSFHRFRYKVVGTKQPNAMHVYIRRDNAILVTLQMTFPVGDNGSMDPPTTMANFDRGVTVDVWPDGVK